MATAEPIASLADVPEESTVCVRVADETGDEREAILVRTRGEDDGSDEVACWLNYCRHLTHIKLDKGSGAPMRDGELVCANHGAYFDCESGECTFGPCEGAYLTAVEITVDDGDVYLTDDGYEFVGPGPIETDEIDRTSTSNVEF
ncbi:Rieske (2Fe-2S) protein [Halosolutus gelatinilyticus]|uniref:Rieske (2Fe-2S) protein n=1 Tax=Halosolutus gelatinilyticus TaxID=2931975 RepID=UPI001FF51720|nr:Rieske 2Fe-2S domain-containing protein [Halosolutus gelatinilyticus]